MTWLTPEDRTILNHEQANALWSRVRNPEKGKPITGWLRMFKVGEDSGNMSDALENVNFFYNREVNDSVDSMVGMIQPALTIVMGVMIFWIIAAVFGPLYESFSKMKF